MVFFFPLWRFFFSTLCRPVPPTQGNVPPRSVSPHYGPIAVPFLFCLSTQAHVPNILFPHRAYPLVASRREKAIVATRAGSRRHPSTLHSFLSRPSGLLGLRTERVCKTYPGTSGLPHYCCYFRVTCTAAVTLSTESLSPTRRFSVDSRHFATRRRSTTRRPPLACNGDWQKAPSRSRARQQVDGPYSINTQFKKIKFGGQLFEVNW